MPCLDHSVVTELREILGEDLNTIAAEFAAQLREQLVPMRAEAAGGDLAEVSRRAHLLKGSAGNLGATALADQFLQVERAARGGDVEGSAAALEIAAELGERCIDELAALGLL